MTEIVARLTGRVVGERWVISVRPPADVGVEVEIGSMPLADVARDPGARESFRRHMMSRARQIVEAATRQRIEYRKPIGGN